MRDCHILIIGGGIGGLTAAIALQHYGFKVSIYEQAPELGEVGAGLTISPNATQVLEFLGLGEGLAELADIPTAGAIEHYCSGEVLLRTYRGDTPLKKYGANYYQIHRADLHGLLADTVLRNDPNCVHLRHAFKNLTQDKNGVIATFENGTQAEGDVLIGCDGGKSEVRSTVFAPEPVVYTGQVAFRALVPSERLTLEAMTPPSKVYMGPDRMFTRYFIRQGTMVNVVGLGVQPGWEEEGWAIHVTIEEFLDQYKDFHPHVLSIIKQVPPELLYKWALRDREPLKYWVKGRVSVLGDAAHPMTPFLGQGAVMAIEDGMVLARCFAQEECYEAALTLYENARKERSNGVQIKSREQGDQFKNATSVNYSPERNAESQGLFEYNPVTVGL